MHKTSTRLNRISSQSIDLSSSAGSTILSWQKQFYNIARGYLYEIRSSYHNILDKKNKQLRYKGHRDLILHEES